MVEHDLAKVGVASSSLVFRSTRMTRKVILFLLQAGSGGQAGSRLLPAYRHLSPIPAWRSDTKPIPNRSMNGVNGWLRHGVPAPRHLRGWFCAMNTDLETSVSGKGSSYGSEHRERISSPCNSGFNGKFCLRYRLHFIIFASECSEYIRGTRKRQEHLRANRRRTGNAIREGSGLCYRQN